jgi:hypothetical protein
MKNPSDVNSNIVLIGLGNMGKKYLRKFEELGLKPTLCDIDASLKEKFKEFPFYCFHGDIEGTPEKVFIMVDPVYHREIAEYFLSKGSYVFLEKPPALSFGEFYNLVEKYGKESLGVSEIERYSPVVKNFFLSPAVEHIEIKRLNKGKGYVNPLWDLGWHDLYLLLSSLPFPQKDGKLLLKEVEKLSSFYWKVFGEIHGEDFKIPFSLEVAWNYEGEPRRFWKILKNSGEVKIIDFLSSKVDKLLIMVKEVLEGRYPSESVDRALMILKALEEIDFSDCKLL